MNGRVSRGAVLENAPGQHALLSQPVQTALAAAVPAHGGNQAAFGAQPGGRYRLVIGLSARFMIKPMGMKGFTGAGEMIHPQKNRFAA